MCVVCVCVYVYIDDEKLRNAQSDEQARAGAEAGSRLLEYITRGAMPGVGGDESKSKLPLFMRVNGNSAHASLHEGTSLTCTYSYTYSYTHFPFCARVAP